MTSTSTGFIRMSWRISPMFMVRNLPFPPPGQARPTGRAALPSLRYPSAGLSRRRTGSGGPRLVGVVDGRRNSRPSGQRATYWAPLSVS